MQALERFGLSVSQMHLDSSSFSLQGEYESASVEPGDLDQVPINICRGYSRDQRPDLKQFVVNLMCSADGGVPLWLKVADGNQSDAQQFAQLMCQFADRWQMEGLFIIDAAFYSEPNIQQVCLLKWVSRVPQTLSDAQVQNDVYFGLLPGFGDPD